MPDDTQNQHSATPPARKRRGRLTAVDKHPQRLEIEALLVRGAPLRPLAKRFGVSFHSLHRHLKRLKATAPETVAAIAAADWKVPPEQLEALRLETSAGWLAMLRRQFDVLVRAQDRNLECGRDTTAAQLAAQAARILQMLGQAVGEINQASVRVQNNFIVNPRYLALRTTLVRVLRNYPDAAREIQAELRRVEAEGFTPADTVRVVERKDSGDDK